jgi:hypothetical protein
VWQPRRMERVFSLTEFEESQICFEILLADIILDLCFEVFSPLCWLGCSVSNRTIGRRRLDCVTDLISESVRDCRLLSHFDISIRAITCVLCRDTCHCLHSLWRPSVWSSLCAAS